jgi:hypothetical protein
MELWHVYLVICFTLGCENVTRIAESMQTGTEFRFLVPTNENHGRVDVFFTFSGQQREMHNLLWRNGFRNSEGASRRRRHLGSERTS